MITLKGGHKLIQPSDDLPNFSSVVDLYLDTETTAFDRLDEDGKPAFSNYPYKGDRIVGVGVLADDDPYGFYVPVRSIAPGSDGIYGNYDLLKFQRWLADTIRSCKRWINHNVNYDAHFLIFDGVDDFSCQMVDTVTLAKAHDSDCFQYGLKELCASWLNMPPDERDRVEAYLRSIKSSNYARVPSDILGEYCIGDVVRNRALFKFLVRERPEELSRVWKNEIDLTPVLFDMERRGLRSDPQKLKVERVKSLRKMVHYSEKIEELTDQPFVNSNDHIFDLLITQHALPVMKYGKEGKTGKKPEPSFDKHALAMYKVHPQVLANPKLLQTIECIQEYRTEAQFDGLFLAPYLHLIDANRNLHPQYNQMVRTGRMSCSRPNSQQLNTRAKELILPRPGMAFASYDASQIEFRLIAHYINDSAAIEAYQRDPKTDFHQWVANEVHIKRKAGKTLNFASGYGAGLNRVTSQIAGDPDVMEEIGAVVLEEVRQGKLQDSERGQRYRDLCSARASEIYTMYHSRFPSLKTTSYRASDVAKLRGYVFNAYGRRRHLPPRHAHKAFNSIVQSCAMDIIKERMVRLAPRYCEWTRSLGVSLVANVHDELLWEGPREVIYSEEFQTKMATELSKVEVEFRVPFLWDYGVSDKSWADAS